MTGFAQVVVLVFKSNTVAEVMEMNKLLAMYKFAKKDKPFFCCMRMRVRQLMRCTIIVHVTASRRVSVVPSASYGVVDRQMSEDNTRTQPLITALRQKGHVSDGIEKFGRRLWTGIIPPEVDSTTGSSRYRVHL